MGKRKFIIEMLKDFRDKLSRDLPIKNIIFFGSRVKGKANKWSDIDLIIVSEKFRKLKFRKRATKMYDYWEIDLPVDFLCFTPEEFEREKKKIGIVKNAVKEGIELI